MSKSSGLRAILVAGCLMMLAAPTYGADFPSKPLRLVVPFAPGGAADITGRLMAQELSVRSGQRVVVENRPGGSTQVGTEVVAHAEADGYTILLGTSSIVLAAVLDPKAVINAQRDFVPLVNVASAPFVWIVNADLPIRTLAEFLAYAKRNPAKASFGTSGAGSSQHLSGELLNLRGGIKMEHVLYKSESNAITDVAGGHVFAAPAYPLTGRRYHGHAHLLCVQRFDVFLHDHRIRARRYRCTRENTGGSHGLEQVARAARRNALRDLQH